VPSLSTGLDTASRSTGTVPSLSTGPDTASRSTGAVIAWSLSTAQACNGQRDAAPHGDARTVALTQRLRLLANRLGSLTQTRPSKACSHLDGCEEARWAYV